MKLAKLVTATSGHNGKRFLQRRSTAGRTAIQSALSTVSSRLHRAAICATTALTLAFVLPSTPQAEEISVSQWGTTLEGAPYAVAMAKGYFREAGINITGILGSSGGGTTVRNIFASATPFGEVALTAAIAAQKSGLKIIITNTGVRNVAQFVWVTMPDSKIKTIKDFPGNKVSFTAPKSVTQMLLLMALRSQGIAPDSVEMISSGGYGPGLTLLENGGVVAAPMIEPARTANEHKYRAVLVASEVLPPLTATVGITSPEFAQKEPKKIAAILAGRRKAVEFIYANPAEASQILAKAFNFAPDVTEKAVARMVAAKTWSLGGFELQGLNGMIEGLRILGEHEGDMDWSKLINTSFLPTDLQQIR